MDSNQVQTPINKFNSEFVDRATEIIDRFYEQIDKCCPSCQALLKSKSGLQTRTAGPTDADDHSETNLNVQR